MKTLGTTIKVSRGEVFTLRRFVTNKDGVPLMIPSNYSNPYLQIIVTSNQYDISNGWFKTYWLSLKDYVKFKHFTPIYISSTVIPPAPTVLDAIYYTLDIGGIKTYYSYDGNRYVPYSFSFAKTFVNKDTSEWIGSIFSYSIKIVSGDKTITWLQGVFESIYPEQDVPDDVDTLVYKICKLRPELLTGVDVTAPLINFATESTILKPSKLIVN